MSSQTLLSKDAPTEIYIKVSATINMDDQRMLKELQKEDGFNFSFQVRKMIRKLYEDKEAAKRVSTQ